MPVATQGAVKSTPINIIEEIGYEMILSNTYHILLRPGLEVIEKFGVNTFTDIVIYPFLQIQVDFK